MATLELSLLCSSCSRSLTMCLMTALKERLKEYYQLETKFQDPADKNRYDQQYAEEMFKRIGQAYHVLSDPNMRKKYDQFGFDALNRYLIDQSSCSDCDATGSESKSISPEDIIYYSTPPQSLSHTSTSTTTSTTSKKSTIEAKKIKKTIWSTISYTTTSTVSRGSINRNNNNADSLLLNKATTTTTTTASTTPITIGIT
ncbi:hypothetical protein PPL_11625 [Heterostelium album PN500]|uniref:J domain-containing protein n=1 Tax=Heterostelium pallidum (strain ATCC 26659 / Pp 5 / PN500) TaxID=670386 RepID=D3BV99_HETP5|nr:hypothetical protein PPL_11625 [Heterostelium album PN500]EFA74656.1 hypothetical protein PPL_11625 [Heterostelium album PN500]|eukprot:XP_020426790.1 hypothetical protein PPL_11625 [Heterostelium album PN500]